MLRCSESRPSRPGDTNRLTLTGDDLEDLDLLQQFKTQALLPLIEDLADWINTLLGPVDINVDNFMDVLDDGVYVCKLAQLISSKAQCNTDKPIQSVKYRERVVRESWFARDNITNFINWCRQFGVKDECLFETEGLVSHRDTRNVVLCLLELARIGSQFGVDPPSLVCMEKEIELEERSLQASGKLEAVSHKGPARRPASCIDLTDSRPQSAVKGVGKNGDSRSTARRKSTNFSASSISKLDQEVVKLSSSCSCPQCYRVERLSEGRYSLGGKIVFVRLLKDRHIMVRVGGGWDTLEHYLLQHDPCKMAEFQRDDGGKFLHCVGRYKVS